MLFLFMVLPYSINSELVSMTLPLMVFFTNNKPNSTD